MAEDACQGSEAEAAAFRAEGYEEPKQMPSAHDEACTITDSDPCQLLEDPSCGEMAGTQQSGHAAQHGSHVLAGLPPAEDAPDAPGCSRSGASVASSETDLQESSRWQNQAQPQPQPQAWEEQRRVWAVLLQRAVEALQAHGGELRMSQLRAEVMQASPQDLISFEQLYGSWWLVLSNTTFKVENSSADPIVWLLASPSTAAEAAAATAGAPPHTTDTVQAAPESTAAPSGSHASSSAPAGLAPSSEEVEAAREALVQAAVGILQACKGHRCHKHQLLEELRLRCPSQFRTVLSGSKRHMAIVMEDPRFQQVVSKKNKKFKVVQLKYGPRPALAISAAPAAQPALAAEPAQQQLSRTEQPALAGDSPACVDLLGAAAGAPATSALTCDSAAPAAHEQANSSWPCQPPATPEHAWESLVAMAVDLIQGGGGCMLKSVLNGKLKTLTRGTGFRQLLGCWSAILQDPVFVVSCGSDPYVWLAAKPPPEVHSTRAALVEAAVNLLRGQGGSCGLEVLGSSLATVCHKRFQMYRTFNGRWEGILDDPCFQVLQSEGSKRIVRLAGAALLVGTAAGAAAGMPAGVEPSPVPGVAPGMVQPGAGQKEGVAQATEPAPAPAPAAQPAPVDPPGHTAGPVQPVPAGDNAQAQAQAPAAAAAADVLVQASPASAHEQAGSARPEQPAATPGRRTYAEQARDTLVAMAIELIQAHEGCISKSKLGGKLHALSKKTGFRQLVGRWSLILQDPSFMVSRGSDPYVWLAAEPPSEAKDPKGALLQAVTCILQEQGGRCGAGALGSILNTSYRQQYQLYRTAHGRWESILEDPRFQVLQTAGCERIVQLVDIQPPVAMPAGAAASAKGAAGAAAEVATGAGTSAGAVAGGGQAGAQPMPAAAASPVRQDQPHTTAELSYPQQPQTGQGPGLRPQAAAQGPLSTSAAPLGRMWGEEARAVLVRAAVTILQENNGRLLKCRLGPELLARCPSAYASFKATHKKWTAILKEPCFAEVGKKGKLAVQLVKGKVKAAPWASGAAAAMTASLPLTASHPGYLHHSIPTAVIPRSASAPGAAELGQAASGTRILLVQEMGSQEYSAMLRHLAACSEVAVDAEWAGEQLCLVQIFAPGIPLAEEEEEEAWDEGKAWVGDGEREWDEEGDEEDQPEEEEGAAEAQEAEGPASLWAHEPTAYLVDPVAAGASGGPDLLASLAPMLTDPCKLKVLHDCREDVARLSRACGGVRIAPVLDTQVAHALQQMAGLGLHKTAGALANASSGTSLSFTASDPGPSSSMAAGAAGAEAPAEKAAEVRPVGLARIGLGRLLELHGLPHPEKEAMATGMRKDPGSYVTMWRTRPLPPHVIQYAAGDVVHLLRVARAQGALDSQLARALSQMQADLYQCPPGPSSDGLLAVDPAVVSALARYFRQGGASEGPATAAASAITGSSLSTRVAPHTAMPQVPLELELLLGPGPRYAPSFRLYTRDAAPPAEQQEGTQAMGRSTSKGDAGASNHPGPALDEDAASVVALMPPAVLPHLLPYITRTAPDAPSGEGSGSTGGTSGSGDGNSGSGAKGSGVGSSLMEVVVDEGRDVTVRLRDGTRVDLPVQVHIPEALGLLMGAKKQGPRWRPNLPALLAAAVADASKAGAAAPRDSEQDQGLDGGGGGSWPEDEKDEEDEEDEEDVWQERGPTINPFAFDGRMGLPGTLHRISGMRDRDGRVHALTYRIGRHMPGMARAFTDLLAVMRDAHSVPHPDPDDPLWTPNPSSSHTPYGGGSILLVGKPGVGKTTLLRDITRVLADDLGMGVIVVDTSNEIAGDSSRPHPCIGRARRFMVPQRDQQHRVLVEAVQNHTPDVLVVDEIGTPQEVAAAKTIAQRGVLMVGTAHGTDIHSLLRNPELAPLLGGIQAVTLGDEEARRSNAGSKRRLERAGAPVFSTLIEVLAPNRWRVHRDVAESVDLLLGARAAREAAAAAAGAAAVGGSGSGGGPLSNKHAHDMRGGPSQSLHPHAERRRYDSAGRVVVAFETATAAERALAHAQTAAGKEGEAGHAGRGGPGGAWGMDGMWLHDLWNVALLQAARGFAAGQAK